MLNHLQRKHRDPKVHVVLSMIGNPVNDSLLDVGGAIGREGEFDRLSRAFKSVVIANLVIDGTNPGENELVQADGRLLPFADRSFDWVFSNAVIEHVGDAKLQAEFANEIRRVSRKGYFVFTPNSWFPIDPHSLVPCFQLLSPRWQRKLAPLVPGPYRKWPDDDFHLLSSKKMRLMFQEARVVKTGFRIWANNLDSIFVRDL